MHLFKCILIHDVRQLVKLLRFYFQALSIYLSLNKYIFSIFIIDLYDNNEVYIDSYIIGYNN